MLFPFLLCILILYIPAPSGGTAAPWPLIASGVTALALLNAAAGWIGTGLAIRLASEAGPLSARAANRVFSFLKGCMVGFVLADVLALRWPALVDELLAAHWWGVLARDVALLVPVLVMALTVMAFQHRFEYRQGRVSLALGPYLWLRFRVELAIILVPWLALVLLTGATSLAFEGSELAGVAEAIAAGAVVVGVVVLSPVLLRVIWSTSSLPSGPLRQRLDALCRRERFRCQDILVWHTHRHLANAAVVGPVPFLRYVLLTDALLRNCTAEEAEAVFAHEIGHVRRHHLPLYLVFGAAFLCFYVNVLDLVALTGWVQPLPNLLAFDMSAGQATVMLTFAAVYWGLGFGFLSRRMEQQADLFAMTAASEPLAFLTGLGKLAAASPPGSEPRSASSWRHFSIERRVGFLTDVLADPTVAARFQRRMAAMQVALLAAFALAAARLLIFRPGLFTL